MPTYVCLVNYTEEGIKNIGIPSPEPTVVPILPTSTG